MPFLYQAGNRCDDSVKQVLVVVVVLHRSVTEKNINKLVIVVVTGIADAFIVVNVEVVDVVFRVEVVAVVESVVHLVGDLFKLCLWLILLTTEPQFSP